MNRTTLSRLYFYTKLGITNYLAWWLGIFAYITIIYALILKPYFNATLWVYALIFIGFLIVGFFLGYYMKKLKVYGQEHAINTETNPYINKLIGKKEILSWQMGYLGIQQSIKMTRLWISFFKHHWPAPYNPNESPEELKEIEALLVDQEKLLKEYESMLNEAR